VRFGTSSLICLNSFSLLVAADKRADMVKIIVVAITVNMNEANAFDSNVMTMNILFYYIPFLVAVIGRC
jgi:hypothetical protein